MSLDKPKKKVIVVEDDVTNGRLLNMMLTRSGFDVSICPSIASTKETATLHTDAFIIDCKLGTESGLDLVKMIRAGDLAVPSTVHIIVASGNDGFEPEATALGANAFMLKPYPLTELIDQLDRLLSPKFS